jgi:hypothetical protein
MAIQDPFKAATEIVKFKGSLVNLNTVESQFTDQSGNARVQVRVVIVRWPQEEGIGGRARTFSRYYGAKKDIRSLAQALQKLNGFRSTPGLDDVIPLLPLHFEWEERPQGTYKDKDTGEYRSRNDLLIPVSKVSDDVPEDVEVEIANAQKTEEEMESGSDGEGGSTEAPSAMMGDIVASLAGRTLEEAEAITPALAEKMAEEYGSKVYSFIDSGETLNQLLAEGRLVIREGVLELGEEGEEETA